MENDPWVIVAGDGTQVMMNQLTSGSHAAPE